jgi:L-rhamnose mutarotase
LGGFFLRLRAKSLEKKARQKKFVSLLKMPICQLFAYAEIENEAQWQAIAQTPECQKWWRHMGDIMPSNPDHSPKAMDLREVFHLE